MLLDQTILSIQHKLFFLSKCTDFLQIYRDAKSISRTVKSKKNELDVNSRVARDNRGIRATRRVQPQKKHYAAEVRHDLVGTVGIQNSNMFSTVGARIPNALDFGWFIVIMFRF